MMKAKHIGLNPFRSFQGHSSFYLVSLVTLLLLISGCSSQQAPEPQVIKPATPVAETAPSTKPAPKIDPTLYQLGLDALAVNDLSGARKNFQQFIQRYPQLPGAYLNLALIDYRQENYEQAEKLLEIALSLNPEQAVAFHIRGLIDQQQGRIKQARDNYLRAIELNPDYMNAHYNLALLYDIYLQEIALAIQHYNQYLNLTTEQDSATREWVNHLQNTLNNG